MNVYDFDETIYDGESALDYFFYYLKKTPWLVKYIPKVFHALAQYKAGKLTVDDIFRSYVSLVEGYLETIDDFEGDALDFWNKHEHKIKPFYASLHRPDDVIITASPEFTTKIICGRLGIENCIGSDIDFRNCKVNTVNMRSKKINAFLAAYPDAEIENFYTDSEKNDAPLIEMAKHAFIVKGNKITQIK